MRLGVSQAIALLTFSLSSAASAQDEKEPMADHPARAPATPPKESAEETTDSTEPNAKEAAQPDDAGPSEEAPSEPTSETEPDPPADSESSDPKAAKSKTKEKASLSTKNEVRTSVESTQGTNDLQEDDGSEEEDGTQEKDDSDEEEDANDRDEADAVEVDDEESPPVPANDRSRRTGFIVAPRLGLLFGGATHLDLECEETGSLGCGTFGVRDHDEASGFGIALDALYGIIPELRAGLSLHYLPQVKGDAGGEVRRLGTGLDFQAVAEGVFDLTDRFAITLRVQGGGTALVPGGFVDDLVKDAQDDCETARDAGVDCTVSDGPYFAPTLGGGAGILVQTKGPARLRLDFLFQAHRIRLYEQNAATDGGTVEAVLSMDQSRLWLLGGFEI